LYICGGSIDGGEVLGPIADDSGDDPEEPYQLIEVHHTQMKVSWVNHGYQDEVAHHLWVGDKQLSSDTLPLKR